LVNYEEQFFVVVAIDKLPFVFKELVVKFQKLVMVVVLDMLVLHTVVVVVES